MKKLWLNVIKPKGSVAKWMAFLLIVGIIAFGTSGYFDPVREYLDSDTFSYQIGDYRLTAYRALNATLFIILIFWVAAIISDIAETRVGKLRRLRAANRALVLKLIQIGIYVVSFLLVMNVIGIDLTALTVFSGALGIGLGFGLQKIASNFISGIILLMEKSVEQGDLIELQDGILGFVRKANARHTLLETFDNREILIPNEDLITGRVTNWTLSSSIGRVEVSVGVSYGSDIEKAYELILEAAREHDLCMDDPEPKCYLREFGDSSVNFTLFFWVADITQGRWTPQSEVMFKIWRTFKENGIEIPFPQRDLHLKTPDMIKIAQTAEKEAKSESKNETKKDSKEGAKKDGA